MDRISRKTFFIRMLALILIDFGLYYFLTNNFGESGIGVLILASILMVGLKIDTIIRRLHDMNLSGLYSILIFVPVVNFAVLALFLNEGTAGGNKYGSDPLKRAGKIEKKQENFSQAESPSKYSEPLEPEKMEEKILLLEEGYKDGLFTQVEFDTKKKKLVEQQNELITKQQNIEQYADKKAKLNNLFKNGLISKEEHNTKLGALKVGLGKVTIEIKQLDLNSNFYYISSGEQHGPYTVKHIISLLNSKKINPNCLVRHEDENSYNKRAKELLQVSSA